MEKKKWWQSKTIWGILISAGGVILLNQGVDVAVPENPDFEQLKEYYEQVKAAQGDIGKIIGVIVSAVGFLLTLYGRFKASTAVSKSIV